MTIEVGIKNSEKLMNGTKRDFIYVVLGSYWGEYGFFRIAMHQNNLGIEESCVWAVPKMS